MTYHKIKLKVANILQIANRTVKWSEIKDSGEVVICMSGIFPFTVQCQFGVNQYTCLKVVFIENGW